MLATTTIQSCICTPYSSSTSFAFSRFSPTQHNDTHPPIQPILSHAGIPNQWVNCPMSDLWCTQLLAPPFLLIFQATEACISMRYHYLHVFKQSFTEKPSNTQAKCLI